jgi:uncharacterized protein YbjQ (UPF0145 family)
MWYASCSTGAHRIPSTVAPCVVLEADASGAPASSGIPSGPRRGAAAWVVEVELVLLAAGVLLAVAVLLAAGLWELELLLLLAPHAASAHAAISDSAIGRRRADIAAANGSGRRAVVSCAQMSQSADLPMTTALELPGERITENLGVCYGLVVRSMGLVGGVTSSFRALRRGEVSEYTQLLEDSRRHAIDRMSENARLLGADAIIAVRFDSSEIGGQFTEIVAYGTAVKVQPTD